MNWMGFLIQRGSTLPMKLLIGTYQAGKKITRPFDGWEPTVETGIFLTNF
jgi:hypothetical protein